MIKKQLVEKEIDRVGIKNYNVRINPSIFLNLKFFSKLVEK